MIAVAAVYGYLRAFSFFGANDDEGYILQSIRSYLAGGRLFDEVFTQYGPGFYAFASLIHHVFRVPLTHDAERYLTVAMWVATSAVSAATVLRLTRSLLAAALTFIGVFVQLTPLIGEPGHPQGVLVLVIALVTLVGAWGGADSLSPRHAAVAGALTAFAILVKINVGAYLALGFAVPVLMSSRLPRTFLTTLLLATLSTLVCALPLVVARNHVLDTALNYALIVSLSIAATVLVTSVHRRASLPAAVLLWFALATAAGAALLLVPVLAGGTSPRALLDGILLRPSRFDKVFAIPLLLPDSSRLAAGAGVALSAAWVLLVKTGRTPSPSVVAVAKALVAGLGLYLCRTGLSSQLAYFTPFLWIVVLPSGHDARGSRLSARGAAAPFDSGPPIGRSILALVASIQSFQAYPVAGTQLAFATFLMIPIVFTCAHDAVVALEARIARTKLTYWALHASLVVAGILFYRGALNSFPWSAAYDVGYELRLTGAERLRLPAADVARFQWLTATVAGNCGTLLTLPGLYSINAWSGVKPANGLNATTWMTLLSDAEQASVWKAIDSSDRACAIYSAGIASNWLYGRSLESLPARREMMARFREVAAADGFALLMRDADVRRSPVMMRLASGRQAFERRRSQLPILAAFAAAPTVSTLRTWFKSSLTGVIVGCQSGERAGIPSSRWLPMLYIGNTGHLRGQHWTADMRVHTTERTVNDGAWHHAALVRQGNNQHLYVDGTLVGSSSAVIETTGLSSCQAGTGVTTLWPDGPQGWMPFNGEIDGLAVGLEAWSADRVVEDWRRTKPRD